MTKIEALREQIVNMISDCEMRQEELFEEKYPESERVDRTYFDTTDINRQARLEYANHILKACKDADMVYALKDITGGRKWAEIEEIEL